MSIRGNILMLASGLLLMLFSLSVASGQMRNCPDIVQTAMLTVNEMCAQTGRNEVCYGNAAMDAQPQANIARFEFEQQGDIEDISKLQALQLYELNEEEGVWGIALMRLQASIPDSLPGQNVTFLLFGDVAIAQAETTSGDGNQAPMQAFYLQTGFGAVQCNEAPQNGLLVQTPDGIDEVTFNINGVDVAVGSTVFFQAAPQREMIVSTIEGSAMMRIGDASYPVIAGTRLRFPIDERLQPIGRPALPEAYAHEDVSVLPIALLEREITIREPLDGDTLNQLQQRLELGEPPCDMEGLPQCEDMGPVVRRINELGDATDWSRDEGVYDLFDGRQCIWQPIIASGRRLSLCNEALDEEAPGRDRPFSILPDSNLPDDNRPCVYRPRPDQPPLPPEETRPFCEDGYIGEDQPVPDDADSIEGDRIEDGADAEQDER
ncbi:MAG: hypothetical protein H6670_05195 [Anaerolineaceae bacterium]|nr:hypothetical protein [Anaerolineaceae bacterium]